MTNQKEGEEKSVLILDTSAFVAGFDPLSTGEEQYTVPLVEEEIVGDSMSSVRIKAATESGRLKIMTPSPDFVGKVKRSASLVGDKFRLSETDIQVLALALELRTVEKPVMILTDDYSIQNVANEIGVEFSSLATFGIKYKLEWMRYCPACYKRYPSNYCVKTCEVCGTQLKRKSIKKNNLRKVPEIKVQAGENRCPK
jgi:UPF0271 protein